MFFIYVVSPSLPYLKPLFLCLHPLFMGSHTIWYLGKTLGKKHTNVSPCPISKCRLVWLTLKYIAIMKQLAPKIVYKFPKYKTQIVKVKKEGGSHVLKKLNLEEFLQLG